MNTYKKKRNAENKKAWRESLPRKKADEMRTRNAARNRKRLANYSPDSLLAHRKRNAANEKRRVSLRTTEISFLKKQMHADKEWFRVNALPEEKQRKLRADKTRKQKEKRAAMPEEEKKRQREKDAKRKRDKRAAKKSFRKKLRGHLEDKCNPMPLWLLCDIHLDNRNIDTSRLNPFPKYNTFMVDFRGKSLDMYLPKFKPGPY